MRATATTNALDNGADIAKVQEWLGHANIATTRIYDHLRKQGHHPAPGDLAHLSPLGWEHINLTGDYQWDTSPALGPDQFRPLRTRIHDFAAAA